MAMLKLDSIDPPRVVADARNLHARPIVRGKFLWQGAEKLYARGVTYGPFRPDARGREFDLAQVERDFSAMAARGINSVRLYTVPPRELLDCAARHGLWVLIGLPWEQHLAFLNDRDRPRLIELRLRELVHQTANHSAVLGYVVGNEISSEMIRWLGPARVERFLAQLASAVREEDPGRLVAYANFPETEFLDLSFADFACFNVYLESIEAMKSYLPRLQTLAGERPLILGEIGLDSLRNGEAKQAKLLEGHIASTFAAGCAGAFVFSWTDEWHRGGHDILDWQFGLTRRDRSEKLALSAVEHAYIGALFPGEQLWPKVTVAVCTHNGSRTLRECLAGILNLKYPDFEVIVVDDGSTDASAEVAREFEVVLLRSEHAGLSAARNFALQRATGEVIAYIDDDATPDEHWLQYLVQTMQRENRVAVGGPNLAPASDGAIADCVALAPGGPMHVLLTDNEAEHIPGCNMAFCVRTLRSIGGFDPQFRIAGDDVDLCWRVREAGHSIGFHPSAVVWHHRRNTVRGFLKQQVNYGRAEAILERKWPEKYNKLGHAKWAGRLYGGVLPAIRRVYFGAWGNSSVKSSSLSSLLSIPSIPEWYLVVLISLALVITGSTWGLIACAAMVVWTIGYAAWMACRAKSGNRWLVGTLFVLQPIARLHGRMTGRMTLVLNDLRDWVFYRKHGEPDRANDAGEKRSAEDADLARSE